MSTDQSRTMEQIAEIFSFDKLRASKGGKFYFTFHLKPSMYDTPIEALELSVRAYYSLKRVGLDTIGKLADAIESGVEIKNIRNCGAKTSREIMGRMFLYQYSILPQEKRGFYISEVKDLNVRRNKYLN